MFVFHKVLLMLAVAGSTAQAYATGCDCSCFGTKETILKADYFEGYKDHGFTITKDGENLRLHPIPSRWNKMPTEDLILSGYKDREPIHPELIRRILDKQPTFYVSLMYQHIETTDANCPVDIGAADTGRVKVEFTFETGESVTLYHPSDEALWDRETGNINTDKLLPSPFGYLNQQEKKP
jgi:hypothetical protein